MAAERARPRRGGAEGDPRLRRERPAVGIVRRGAVGREVVRGERAGQLVLAERLEEAGRGEVAAASVAPRQRPVRDLADERLDERVLAAFGRPRVDVVDEQLATDERPAELLDGSSRSRPLTAARPSA